MAVPIRQLLSQTSYAADGVTTVWDFSFASGYIDQSHVKAYYTNPNGTRVDIAVLPGMFSGPYQLTITPAIPAGTTFTIYRDTPKDALLVDFVDRAAFTEVSLDTANKQAIFGCAEATDGLGVAIESVDAVVAFSVAAQASADAAAASQAAAASSAGAAATSATASANAANDSIAIYSSVAEVEAAAAAADASATSALASKNAASTSETNAATSETNALASKNSATASASAAATSEANASASETNALASKNAASTSETNAATSETNALASKNAASTSETNAATSATSAALAAASTGKRAFVNRIINGGFTVNQRGYVSGTSLLGAGLYTHDRWKSGASGCTYTYTVPFTGVPSDITITAGTLQQVIEGLHLPEGGTYTLQWAGTAQARINGGAYAASPLTVTGLTAGSSALVEFNAGTITGGVQFEAGAVASPIDVRSADDEYLLCRRYYQAVKTTIIAATPQYATFYAKVDMRTTPTMTFSTSISPVTFDVDGLGQVRLTTTGAPASPDVTVYLNAEL